MMEIRSSRWFGTVLSADRNPVASMYESFARCGMANATLLAAFADGASRWTKCSYRADTDGEGGPKPDEVLELLGRAGWIGELNGLLAVLIAKHRQILPMLAERAPDGEMARAAGKAAASLWNSGFRWGIALCRLLRLIHLRLQSRAPDADIVRRYCHASVIALQQLLELLIHVHRWRAQWLEVRPDTQDLSLPVRFERELGRLERAWFAARFCGPEERRANLREIGLLQHWTVGLREPYLSRHAFAGRQRVYPGPWLNEMIRMRISG